MNCGKTLYKRSLLDTTRELLVHCRSCSATVSHSEDDSGGTADDITTCIDIGHRGLLTLVHDDIAPLVDLQLRH